MFNGKVKHRQHLSPENNKEQKENSVSILLEYELRNRDHRTNNKQQLELQQNEKRNDEPVFAVRNHYAI